MGSVNVTDYGYVPIMPSYQTKMRNLRYTFKIIVDWSVFPFEFSGDHTIMFIDKAFECTNGY